MESEVMSTSNDKQHEEHENGQSSDSPTCLIKDVFSLNTVDDSTPHDNVLNRLTMASNSQSLLHPETNLCQNSDTCSASEVESCENIAHDEELRTEDSYQNSDLPTFVISDTMDQAMANGDLLNSFILDTSKHLLLHPETSSCQNTCDTCSETEDEFFECRVCGEGFSEMDDLLTHTLAHNEQSTGCGALKGSGKENIDSRVSVPENDYLEVIDLTDDADFSNDSHERAIFRDLESRGQPDYLSVNSNIDMNCSTDASYAKPEGQSRAKMNNSHEQAMKPVSGHSFPDVVDLTDEQEQQHVIHRQTTDGSLVLPLSSVGSLTKHDNKKGRGSSNIGDHAHVCNMCGKGLNTKKTLMEHIRLHSEEKPFKCNLCGMIFKQNAGLYGHMKWHSKKHAYKCNICHKAFKVRASMKIHMEVHREQNPYSCSVCYKAFKYKCNLKSHKMAVHSEDRPHICTVCGQGFKQKFAMRLHMVVHREERPHRCSVCGQGFKMKMNMCRHMAVHRDLLASGNSTCMSKQSENSSTKLETENVSVILDSDKQSLTCSVCGKVSKTRRNATRHMAVHSEEKPYRCSICGKGFKLSYNMYAHMRLHSQSERKPHTPPQQRLHTEERPYSCSVCGKSFREERFMSLHMAAHTVATLYACKICGKGFRRKGQLQRHDVIVHTEERPFECVICRKCCKTKTALASHVRSHTVKQPQTSDVCRDVLPI